MADSKILVLLGAGASCDGGLPLSTDITREIHAAIIGQQRRGWGDVAQALNFICGTLIKYDSERGASPDVFPGIERLVSAVELLRDRDVLEVAPFIDSWDPFVQRIDRTTPMVASFNRDMQEAVIRTAGVIQVGRRPSLGSANFEGPIKQLIQSEISQDGNGAVYNTLLSHLYIQLRQLLTIADSSRFEYLGPLLDLAVDQRCSIATLNYDLSVEMVAESRGISVFTGIENWIEGLPQAPIDDDSIRLIKLHGSINWVFRGGGTLLDNPSLAVVDPADSPNDSPAILFGQREKLRAIGPFIELIAGFVQILERSQVLLVIGYSFQDMHINELIRRWICREESRQIVVLDRYLEPTRDFGAFSNQLWRRFGARPDPPHLPGRQLPSPPPTPRMHIINEPAMEGIAQAASLACSLAS